MGNFVPAQHSDYIFSTVGEEWGLLEVHLLSFYTVSSFTGLFIYLSYKKINSAESMAIQLHPFYLFIFVLTSEWFVGLQFPTIGIPLPSLAMGDQV